MTSAPRSLRHVSVRGVVRGVAASVTLMLCLAVFAACADGDGDGGDGGDRAAETSAGADSTTDDGVAGPIDPSPSTSEPPAPAPTVVEADPTDEATIQPVVFADDFSESIEPIVASNCATCHSVGGPGSAHFEIQTAQDIVDTAEYILPLVTDGAMPPWPSSDLSVPFHDNRSLRVDEIEAIKAWIDAGSELDVPGDTPVVSTGGVAELAEVDAEIGPAEPYDGSTALVDDYRCNIYDPELTEPSAIQGFHFVPDQTEVVHHAIGYLVPAEFADQARAKAAEDDAGGWECFGGSGLPGDDLTFLAWAPGQLPTEYPAGSGLPMQPGDIVVVQIHYHYEVDAPADNSLVQFDLASAAELDGLDEINIAQYVAPAEIPCAADEVGPLCDRDVAMAVALEKFGPGGVRSDGFNQICGVTPEDFADMTDGVATSSCDLPAYGQGEIVSVFGHEHEIGKSFRLTLNPDTDEEVILLDIPDWSFDWQFNYYPVDTITLKRGDRIRIECTWDRARRDPDLEPSYILWADGTNDEMCYSTIVTRQSN